MKVRPPKDILLFDIKESSQRLVTFETSDQSDENLKVRSAKKLIYTWFMCI